MKCPYNSNQVQYTHAKPLRYKPLDVENIDGTPDRLHLTVNDSTYTTVFYQHDCGTADCAPWQNGHCVRTA